MDKTLLAALYDELGRLDPEVDISCQLFMEGKTEREMAANMGNHQSTIN